MTTFMGGSSTCTNSPGACGVEGTCGGDAIRDAPVITPVTPNTPVGGGPLPGSDGPELQSAVSVYERGIVYWCWVHGNYVLGLQ